MQRTLLALVALLTVGMPARAQQPSPARMQAAAELMDAMQMGQVVREIVETTVATQLQEQPELAMYEDIVRDVMSKALDWNEMRGEYIRIYADIYSEEELRQLRTLYQSPLGQRMLRTLPEIANRTGQLSKRRVRQLMPEMEQRMEQRFEEEQKP